MIFAHREREGIALLERATTLSPHDPHIWTFHAVRAMAHVSLGEYEEALQLSRKAVRHPTAPYWPYAMLVACLGLLERDQEAASAAQELLVRMPGYSLARTWADYVEFFHAPESLARRLMEGQQRAGIPGTPDVAMEGVPAQSFG